MKKWLSLMMAMIMVLMALSGCGKPAEDAAPKPAVTVAIPKAENAEAFSLSSIDDVSNDKSERVYKVVAAYTDTYTIRSSDTTSIKLYDSKAKLGEHASELSVALKEGQTYTLAVKTKSAGQRFSLQTEAASHLITLPYDVAGAVDPTTLSTATTSGDPLVPAEVNYIPREGGTYIYSNNPEQFSRNHVGQAFMRNDGLTGEVYVTFEHANYASQDVYLGYQLKNNTDHDVYVTITNAGYQWTGTWFGQRAWYDFYNTKFEFPTGYYDKNGNVSKKYMSFPDYAYEDYEPRVFQPITYRLPAGEYFWALGGTSADSYNNINVDNSADHLINKIRCANGNVKFTVTGGEVTGTMYCYNDISQIADEPEALGYVAEGYAQQYSGIANHHGVIDNYMTWTFNDETSDCTLPVSYTNYYDDKLPSKAKPFQAYNSTPHVEDYATSWMTHLNPQNNHKAVGMDLVEFIWHDDEGKEIIIDNDHADGAGLPANTANWMIEYQDHFTLVNQGDTDRTVTLRLRDRGTLALLVRDSQTGEVLKTRYTMGLCEKGNTTYSYKLTIPAHSVKQVTLDYLLVACSYGSVTHSAVLGTAD